MNKAVVRIWGREFELSVSYQNYPGEEITENQQKETVGMPVGQFEHIFGEDNVINNLNIKPASADKGGRYIW